MSNSEVKINDLLEKTNIEDGNLIIVEDEEDTKKSTIHRLKNNFLGDNYDPDGYRFYSSKKVEELLNNLKIQLSSKASQKDVQELYNIVNQIAISNPDGTKDNEIIIARGSQNSLAERFDYERELSNDIYAHKITKSAQGPTVDLDGHYGFIDLLFSPKRPESESIPTTIYGNVYISSKNIFDLNSVVYDSTLTKCDDINGFQYTQKLTRTLITINFNEQSPGDFYFLSNISFSEDFIDKNIKFILNYKDGTKEELQYNHESEFKFTAKKIINSISLKYDSSKLIENSFITFSDVMISVKDSVSEYIPYHYETIKVPEQNYSIIYDLKNNDYIIRCDSTVEDMTVIYNDDKNSIDSIIDRLDIVESTVSNKIDHCGLLTNIGIYQFFDNCQIVSYPESATISDAPHEYMRNGVNSKKITIDANAENNPIIKQIIKPVTETLNSVGLCFYIDKTVSDNFEDGEGIHIHLSSDDAYIDIANYYTYTIRKSEMIQGWNIIKHQIPEFTIVGEPDIKNIKTVSIEIDRNNNINGQDLYLNCVIFNQSIQPTVILSFDGVYDSSLSYIYPYLSSRGIKPSLLINSAKTLTNETIDYIIKMRVEYGWDIGVYGCNPDKELLENDDNYRNQYMALRSSKQWIQDNFIDNPVSYSAPYGNLRPITVPLLKDLGYKIARTGSDAYISNFSEKDFAIPMQLISNLTTVNKIKTRIDYCINNGVCLSLYVKDVTEYGSDADSTQLMFELIINYIIEKMEEGKLQCLSMKDFYERCTK